MDTFSDRTPTELAALLHEQAQTIALLHEQVEQLKAEIARLKGQQPDGGKWEKEPPSWVKPDQPTPVKKTRRKRAQAFVRHREIPTHEIFHACSQCPDCGRTLTGGTAYSRRQIIELPEIAVRIVDPVLLSRYCGVCRKRHVPVVDWSEHTVGKSCFGVQIHALVAYLRQAGRLPLPTIASLLSALCHLKVSVGEVALLLSRVVAVGKAT